MNNIEVIGNFNMKEFKESFISYLDVNEKTLRAYKCGIDCFTEYLANNNIKQPTRDDIRAFRDMLREKYSSNTTNTYLVSIKALFKYLSIHKLYENVCEDIKGAKISRTPKKQVLTLEQVKEIYNKLVDPRERSLFITLITTGLRGMEVASAKIEDIKNHNGETVLFVQCKKHVEKDEYSKLSDEVVVELKKYIGERTSGFIFVNEYNGNGLTTKTIRLIIKNIFKRFGFDDETLSLHSTRRTAGTIAYQLGADAHDIQQMLHHVNVNTTMIYINSCTRDNNNIESNLSNAIVGGMKC